MKSETNKYPTKANIILITAKRVLSFFFSFGKRNSANLLIT